MTTSSRLPVAGARILLGTLFGDVDVDVVAVEDMVVARPIMEVTSPAVAVAVHELSDRTMSSNQFLLLLFSPFKIRTMSSNQFLLLLLSPFKILSDMESPLNCRI